MSATREEAVPLVGMDSGMLMLIVKVRTISTEKNYSPKDVPYNFTNIDLYLQFILFCSNNVR